MNYFVKYGFVFPFIAGACLLVLGFVSPANRVMHFAFATIMFAGGAVLVASRKKSRI